MTPPGVYHLKFKDQSVEMSFPMGKFESSPYAEEILNFLNPFLQELKQDGIFAANDSDADYIQYVIERMQKYALTEESKIHKLKELMKVQQLAIPYMKLNLPGKMILDFNELEEDDPLVAKYQLNQAIGGKIRDLGVFLDRYDTSKEVLCLLVWSTFDNSLVCLPSIGLVPYPLCWTCKKSFGMSSCSKCGVRLILLVQDQILTCVSAGCQVLFQGMSGSGLEACSQGFL